MGICVRSIAPYIGIKYTDPAVLCVDSTGKTVISVLSGHVGGANELARKVASAIGAMPVITTQSDCVGMWTLDTLARQFDWSVRPQRMNEQIILFTSEKPTALLLSVRDKGTDWLERNLPSHVKVFYHEEDINQDDFELFIMVSPILPQAIRLPYVWYIPQCVHLGIGLAHQAQPVDRIRQEMEQDEFERLSGTTDPEALKEWETWPEDKRQLFLNNALCPNCGVSSFASGYNIRKDRFGIVIEGVCDKCGQNIVRCCY